MYTYAKSLYLLYARIRDLEQRLAAAPHEIDKLKPLYKIVDRVLREKVGVTEDEFQILKLQKYLEG